MWLLLRCRGELCAKMGIQRLVKRKRCGFDLRPRQHDSVKLGCLLVARSTALDMSHPEALL